MKIAAVVLTYRALSTGRAGLLENTLASLQHADYLQVVDNGSDDGTAELVTSWGGVTHDRPLHTSGHGNNLAARVAYGTDADLLVFSDDDMDWHPDWRCRLEAWWSEAPDDLAMTGCHIEPNFRWNTIHDRVVCGGIPGLIRESTGGASWSIPRRMLDVFFAPAGIWQQNQGYGDVMACDRVRERGYRIAQIDAATHAGQGLSTWGNRTETKYGWDVAPVFDLLNGDPMFEITERTTVKDGEAEFVLPVGRIRDEDAVRYGLVGGAVEPELEPVEPVAEPEPTVVAEP